MAECAHPSEAKGVERPVYSNHHRVLPSRHHGLDSDFGWLKRLILFLDHALERVEGLAIANYFDFPG